MIIKYIKYIFDYNNLIMNVILKEGCKYKYKVYRQKEICICIVVFVINK